MKGIIYKISNRYYKGLCEMLDTEDEGKLIEYLNKNENLKDTIIQINVKKAAN